MSTPVIMSPPVFRFAPSPNGRLHLGHALSALLNRQRARETGGRLLLRIEDIDPVRCTPALEAAMLEDLRWLGFDWDGVPWRQSERMAQYRAALERLMAEGLVYPSAMSRGTIRARVAALEAGGTPWPRDPDGSPLYPGSERELGMAARRALLEATPDAALRLDMTAAIERAGPLAFTELGEGQAGGAMAGEHGRLPADPTVWGDVVLGRRGLPASYHLAVAVDDAAQGVSEVVRGRDLFAATALHRLLQALLGLPEPVWRHHRLILGPDGTKLSKSLGSTALAALREAGATRSAIRRLIGLDEADAGP